MQLRRLKLANLSKSNFHMRKSKCTTLKCDYVSTTITFDACLHEACHASEITDANCLQSCDNC